MQINIELDDDSTLAFYKLVDNLLLSKATQTNQGLRHSHSYTEHRKPLGMSRMPKPPFE